ncbi:MAG TPA: carboxypeptidase-like regulatory domain-containing protein [Flavipsychrobacter sp.]|nr:carboxypeptidase-like regulatory domain-containing protein [Flavipsychrobacter sp.]
MKTLKRLYFLIFLAITSVYANAQTLKGIVEDGETGKPLAAVSVYNAKTQQYVYTNEIGAFSLPASKGDLISFSFVGYKTQTKLVPAAIGVAEMHIDLFRLSYQLDEFIYRPKYSPYQLDSMERKSTYQRALARERTRSIMSPVTLLADKLSKNSKQIYRFQKSFNYWEDAKFIESRYSTQLVQQMTGLKGDTLAHFMNSYPMPYDYARVASDLELKMWVRERYREWMKNPVYPAIIQTTDSTKAQSQ